MGGRLGRVCAAAMVIGLVGLTLGCTPPAPPSPPSPPSRLTSVTSLVAGLEHACALMADTTVRCWGGNDSGQLGDGTLTNSKVAVKVRGLAGVAELAASGDHTCARLVSGRVLCWGGNGRGQLGAGSTAPFSTDPVEVASIDDAVALAAGGPFSHTCAVRATGEVACWGDDEYGELGDGTLTTAPVPTPVAVGGMVDATAVAAGGRHSCALLADTSVRCWGFNASGQLGDGAVLAAPPFASPSPVGVSGLSGVVAVTAGFGHTCALLPSLLANGTVACWGDNSTAQLGPNSSAALSAVPLLVGGLGGVASIDAGQSHTCARLLGGTIRCWGDNSQGELGDGTISGPFNPGVATPVTVSGISAAVGISAGLKYSCALLVDGTAKCWGDNTFGQLGNNSTVRSALPVEVLTGP